MAVKPPKVELSNDLYGSETPEEPEAVPPGPAADVNTVVGYFVKTASAANQPGAILDPIEVPTGQIKPGQGVGADKPVAAHLVPEGHGIGLEVLEGQK